MLGRLRGLKEEVDLVWRGQPSADSRAVMVEESTSSSPYAEPSEGSQDDRSRLGGVRRLLDVSLPAVSSKLNAHIDQLGSAAAITVNDLANLAANTVPETDVQRHIAVVHAWAQGDVSATHELYHRAVSTLWRLSTNEVRQVFRCCECLQAAAEETAINRGDAAL
jgi:hypothetical protein